MIIPATIFRIVGFINEEKQSLEKEVQEGGLVFVYTDEGNPAILKMISNKKDLTLEDMRAYFINKRNSVIKQKEIDSVAGELEYLEDFEIELEKEIEKLKGKDRKEIIQFKKNFKKQKAREIVEERRTITTGTIIRTVIDTPDKKQNKKVFKGKEYNLFRSRCLIFNQEGKPTTTGLYYFSQTENLLPIEIEPIFSKEGESLGLFSIHLSKLATLKHFNYLVEHTIRSLNKDGRYVGRIKFNYEKVREHYSLLKEMNSKTKDLQPEETKKYIDNLRKLQDIINKKPRMLVDIQLGFNLLITKGFMISAKEVNSPFVNLKNTLVNLLYSKQNPDFKEVVKQDISNYIEKILEGEEKGKILTTYHTPALSLSEEPSSWGFMTNNIQLESFVLSGKDTYKLFKKVGVKYETN